MGDEKKKIAIKKGIAIGLMAVAFVMLCMNWIKLGRESRTALTDYKLEFDEMLKEGLEVAETKNLEEALKAEGHSAAEAEKMAKGVDGMQTLMSVAEKGKFSVFSMAVLTSALSDIKPVISDESLMGASDAEEMGTAFGIVQLVCYIVIALFVAEAVLMGLSMFSHFKEKKALGIPAVLLAVVLMAGVWFVSFILKVGIGDTETGLTFAPFLTVFFAIASCVVWGSVRKQISKK